MGSTQYDGIFSHGLAKEASPAGKFFIPNRPQFLKSEGQFVSYSFDGRHFHGTPELFVNCYRSLICTMCRSKKSAVEFLWNRKGVEGPFSNLWGKRDCWCTDCRSKDKAKKYKEKLKLKLALQKRRHKSNVVDVSDFEIIVNYRETEVETYKTVCGDLISLLIEGKHR